MANTIEELQTEIDNRELELFMAKIMLNSISMGRALAYSMSDEFIEFTERDKIIRGLRKKIRLLQECNKV